MSKIWTSIILICLFYGLFTDNISSINQVISSVGEETLNFCLPLIAVLSLYNGILKIAEVSGMVEWIQKLLKPLLKKILPDIKHNEKALGYISLNVALNMIGLGSAATPSGLKAMEELQKENKDKDTASRSMVTFIIMNTAGVTFISSTVIALRTRMNAVHPTSFIPLGIVVTLLTSCIALCIDRWCNYRK